MTSSLSGLLPVPCAPATHNPRLFLQDTLCSGAFSRLHPLAGPLLPEPHPQIAPRPVPSPHLDLLPSCPPTEPALVHPVGHRRLRLLTSLSCRSFPAVLVSVPLSTRWPEVHFPSGCVCLLSLRSQLPVGRAVCLFSFPARPGIIEADSTFARPFLFYN